MQRPLSAVAIAIAAISAPGFATAQPLGASDIALLNRLTWGVSFPAAVAYSSMGRDRWIERQLHPSPTDRLPTVAQALIDAMAISTTPLPKLVVDIEAQTRAASQIADPEQKKAALIAARQPVNALARQAAQRQILRALYSPDQLQDQLTWFWLNHFNVFEHKSSIEMMIGDYEESVIRPHALGRFRDLLEATLRHPAMLRYLDNANSAVGHVNENYAREIMELHTMGVGSGYSQSDVQALARILTGVGIDEGADNPKLRPAHAGDLVRAGLFEFNPDRHDYRDKVFLGHVIKGSGFAEVEQALNILAREPSTRTHICHELAVYFVSDAPPQSLVDRMARTFQRTDGDIAAVMDTMIRSPEFKASLGGKFKDPAHYVISAVRLAYGDKVILNTAPVEGWLGRLAQAPYNHETPDGYSMVSPVWDGPGQMAVRFEIGRQIGSGGAGLFKPDQPGAAERPSFPMLQNALYFGGLADTLSPATRSALDQAASPQEWNTLFLASPEFMRR